MPERGRPLRSAGLAAVLLAMAGACTDTIEVPNPVARDRDVVERGIPPLTAGETRLYLQNSTLSHEGETRMWHVYLREDGSMTGLAIGLEEETRERANGRWTVAEDGRFCRQWENDWGGGRFGCAEVYRYGDDYLFVADTLGISDPQEYRRTRRAGNPMRL